MAVSQRKGDIDAIALRFLRGLCDLRVQQFLPSLSTHFMKKSLLLSVFSFLLISAEAQKIKPSEVPSSVKSFLQKNYPNAKSVRWEKESGNYEASWGGKSGEDHSVQISPSGELVEYVQAIPVSTLPAVARNYIKLHYKNAKITEAGKVTDAKGKISYEAEVHGKDILFDEKGNFVKAED
jgi:hypothetical protein